MSRAQWEEGYEEGEGTEEEYYEEEGGDYSGLSDEQPQNIPPEIDPEVSFFFSLSFVSSSKR